MLTQSLAPCSARPPLLRNAMRGYRALGLFHTRSLVREAGINLNLWLWLFAFLIVHLDPVFSWQFLVPCQKKLVPLPRSFASMFIQVGLHSTRTRDMELHYILIIGLEA